jgi:hypothetical protein
MGHFAGNEAIKESMDILLKNWIKLDFCLVKNV